MYKSMVNTVDCKKIRKSIFLSCLGLLLPFEASAFVAKMENIPVSNEAYSRAVLEKVISAYNPPLETQGAAKVLVRIGRDGRPYSCELKSQVNGYAIYTAICNAVLNVQPFGSLQENTPYAEITLVFEHDEPFMGIDNRVLPPIASVDEVFENSAMPTSSVNNTVTPVQNTNVQVAESTNQNVAQSTLQVETQAQSISGDILVVENVQSTSDNLQVVELAPATQIAVEENEVENKVEVESDISTALPISPVISSASSVVAVPVYTERLENEEIVAPVQNIPTEQKTVFDASDYTNTIIKNIKNQLLVPLELKEGSYTMQIGMMVDPSGELLYYSVLEPSASSYADDAVVTALTTSGVVPPTPSGQEEEVIFEFTVVK